MSDALQALAADLSSLEASVQRVSSRHVNTRKIKEAAKRFVQGYFAGRRPALFLARGDNDHLAVLDAEMQNLLRCTQKRALVTEYRRRLRAVRRAIDAAELAILSSPARGSRREQVDRRQERILETLRSICPSAAASYAQGIADLRAGQRESWRGPAVEFREAIRETLDCLAPDDDVTRQPGFKPEPNANGPTMRQKAMSVLRARSSKDPQVKALGDAVDVVEEAVGRFVRSVYARSSTAVHLQAPRDEAVRIRDYATLVLAELLEIGD